MQAKFTEGDLMQYEQDNDSRDICVYYNSACPICSAGIEYQKGKTPEADIEWGDVHTNNSLVEGLSSDLETVRKYLHLTDQQGQLHVGIDAFIVIWRNSKNQAYLAKIFSSPLIHPIATIAYLAFAKALYRWNRWKKHW